MRGFILTIYHLGNGKKNEIDKTCGKNGDRRGAYIVLVGRHDGRRPLGRPRRRWIYNSVGGAWTVLIWLRTGGGLL